MDFLSTIEPYEINPKKWWADKPVDDVSSLKPDSNNDILLIVGDGSNVLEDLWKFVHFREPYDLMCMNYSPKIIPESWDIDFYIAGDSHTPDMQAIAKSLKNVSRHCWNADSPNFDIRWSRNHSKPWTGTTANLGVKIGIALGYLKIVLAGCPMDQSGNWYKTSLQKHDIKRHKDHTAHLWKWTEIASRPIGRFIRSMSGNTADLYGKPTKKWLQDV
jgi:hypothetical protein